MGNANLIKEIDKELELHLDEECPFIPDSGYGACCVDTLLEEKISLTTEENRKMWDDDITYSEESFSTWCHLNTITKQNINNLLIRALGMSYDDLLKLDLDEQHRIIREYHKKNSKLEHDVLVMIGNGEHSGFIKAGLTLKASKKRLDDRIDEASYSKPALVVKKLIKKIRG